MRAVMFVRAGLRDLAKLVLVTASIALAAPAMAEQAPASAYELGANDEIEVTIYGPTTDDVKTRIRDDGSIVLPYLGSVSVAGRTVSQLSEYISDELVHRGILVAPVVKVDVLTFVANTVTVGGTVNTPGLIPIDRPMTVGMVVARAGGVRSDGADFVMFRRKGQVESTRIRLSDVGDPDKGANTRVAAGDTIVVPQSPLVYVYGSVGAPGAFPYHDGMTVRQAIARAGGPTLAGSARGVVIFRGKNKIKRVDLESEVLPDDTLKIPEKIF